MTKLVPALLSLLILSACASTPSTDKTTSSNDVRKPLTKAADGTNYFLHQKDGSKFQPRLGLYCPANVMDGAIESTHIYDEDATDASCYYKGNGGITTIYLSTFPNNTLDEYFDISTHAVENGSLKDEIEFKKDLTDSCMMDPQLMSVMSQLLTGASKKDNVITIDMSGNSGEMPYKIAVYGGSEYSSYVAVSPIDDKYMKIRYTIKRGISEENANRDCAAIHALMRDQIASVGKSGGAKAKTSILDLGQPQDKSDNNN